MFNFIKNLFQEKKIAKLRKELVAIYLAIIFFLALLIVFFNLDLGKNKVIEYGVTFSHKYAQELGLNWQEVYTNLLADMNVKHFRLMAYWDEVEKEMNEYDYSEIDWLVEEAANNNADIILVVGKRQPRWPECHQPHWIGLLDNSEDINKAELKFVTNTINHFKKYDNIVAWQVDNEPFLSIFGECVETDKEFYAGKIDLVRKLDNRPTIMTDSGELSTWFASAKLNPILGISVYRNTWNRWYGKFYYPLAPAYYYLKYQLVKLLTPLQEVFISELQLEPWSDKLLITTSLDEQMASMNIEYFNRNISYAKRIGFDKIYLWGAEWWYWMKVTHNDNSFWEQAKLLFK